MSADRPITVFTGWGVDTPEDPNTMSYERLEQLANRELRDRATGVPDDIYAPEIYRRYHR